MNVSVRRLLLSAMVAMLMIMLMPFDSLAISKPGTPTIYVYANSNSSIFMEWSKPKGASGYQIYRGGSQNGSYRKVKTINSGKKTSWTCTGLTKGKTYYFKVRAFKKSKGKKVYGKYSKPDLARATSDPYYVENIRMDESRSSLSYIDCEFTNWSTHNIVFKNDGVSAFILSIADFNVDDEDTYEPVTIYSASNNDYYYPDEVVVEPGEYVTIIFETNNYYVDYDPQVSALICDADFYGDDYMITFLSDYTEYGDDSPVLLDSAKKMRRKSAGKLVFGEQSKKN